MVFFLLHSMMIMEWKLGVIFAAKDSKEDEFIYFDILPLCAQKNKSKDWALVQNAA